MIGTWHKSLYCTNSTLKRYLDSHSLHIQCTVMFSFFFFNVFTAFQWRKLTWRYYKLVQSNSVKIFMLHKMPCCLWCHKSSAVRGNVDLEIKNILIFSEQDTAMRMFVTVRYIFIVYFRTETRGTVTLTVSTFSRRTPPRYWGGWGERGRYCQRASVRKKYYTPVISSFSSSPLTWKFQSPKQ